MIGVYLVLTISIGIFAFLLNKINIVDNVKLVVSLAKDSINVVKAKNLTDEQKEEKIQRVAIKLLQLFIIILLQTLFLLIASALMPIGGAYIGLYSFDQLVNAASNIYFIVISSILMIAIIWQLGKSSG